MKGEIVAFGLRAALMGKKARVERDTEPATRAVEIKCRVKGCGYRNTVELPVDAWKLYCVAGGMVPQYCEEHLAELRRRGYGPGQV
jgi:hypothetical protein